jgi:biotin operon repressor
MAEATFTETPEDLATLFKALADPTRLRLVGLMVDKERCGQELAHVLGLSPATVSHHMKVLRQAGLLRETRQQPYTFFRLDLGTLQGSLRRVANRKQVRMLAEPDTASAADRKVLKTFFDGPRLTAIPSQRKKKQIVFEEILRRLPRRKEYPERELSRFIETIHSDFCTIRREFIMGRYMEREAGVYRLTEKGRAVLQG